MLEIFKNVKIVRIEFQLIHHIFIFLFIGTLHFYSLLFITKIQFYLSNFCLQLYTST